MTKLTTHIWNDQWSPRYPIQRHLEQNGAQNLSDHWTETSEQAPRPGARWTPHYSVQEFPPTVQIRRLDWRGFARSIRPNQTHLSSPCWCPANWGWVDDAPKRPDVFRVSSGAKHVVSLASFFTPKKDPRRCTFTDAYVGPLAFLRSCWSLCRFFWQYIFTFWSNRIAR